MSDHTALISPRSSHTRNAKLVLNYVKYEFLVVHLFLIKPLFHVPDFFYFYQKFRFYQTLGR